MISGPSRPVIDDTRTATHATVTRWRSVAMSGSSRASDARMPGGCAPGGVLARTYELVLACTALGVIDLRVFRRRLQKVVVPPDGKHFAFHEQDDLVVVRHRRDLLRDG